MGGPLLPVLFVDRPLPDGYDDLVAGQATVVGPDDDDLAAADGVIAGSRRWDAEAMDRAPRLKVISRTGIGYDTVDVAAATLRGITVCYAPDAPTISTAEHAVALLLAVTKDVFGWSGSTPSGAGPLPGIELDGRTLGLFGYGRIARRVGVVGLALGMEVIAHDPYVEPGSTDGAVALVDVDELWRRSEVLSLHAPATASTRHVVNAETLALLPTGAYLVNCARGSLVDHDALVDALRAGHLAGAGLDVTEPEPLPPDHPLRDDPRVIITPHIASHTGVGRRRLYEHAIGSALAVLAGRPGCVVPEQCTP